jgi:hypothetical protein
VQATQHGAKWPAGIESLDVIKRVDHAGMGATQHHHHAGGCVEKHRLIVPHRIGLRGAFIQKEASARILVRSAAGNFSGDKQAFDHLRAGSRFNDLPLRAREDGAAGFGQADETRRAIGLKAEFRFPRRRVQENRRTR